MWKKAGDNGDNQNHRGVILTYCFLFWIYLLFVILLTKHVLIKLCKPPIYDDSRSIFEGYLRENNMYTCI